MSRYNATKFKTITVGVEEIEISIDGGGLLWAQLPSGEHLSGRELKPLEAKVRAHLKKANQHQALATIVMGDEWEERRAAFKDVTVTGKHSQNGDYLARDADGDSERLGRYGSGDLMVRLTEQDRADYVALLKALGAAQDAVEAWKLAHKFTDKHLKAGG